MTTKDENNCKPSVVFRKGPLTVADYDEAIKMLQGARKQLIEGHEFGCAVCGDSHSAAACHHNPLLVARRVSQSENTWRCFHCGAVFNDETEAEHHFGRTEQETPVCQRTPAPVEISGLSEAIDVCSKAPQNRDKKSLNDGMYFVFYDELQTVLNAAKAYAALPKPDALPELITASEVSALRWLLNMGNAFNKPRTTLDSALYKNGQIGKDEKFQPNIIVLEGLWEKLNAAFAKIGDTQ